MRARHRDEARGAVEPDGLVAEGAERRQVAPGPHAEVEDRERRRRLDVPQQRATFCSTSWSFVPSQKRSAERS
jgi:hypothetical protein